MMNNKDPNKNKINIKVKNIQNSKNKFTSILNKAINLEKEGESRNQSSKKKEYSK